MPIWVLINFVCTLYFQNLQNETWRKYKKNWFNKYKWSCTWVHTKTRTYTDTQSLLTRTEDHSWYIYHRPHYISFDNVNITVRLQNHALFLTLNYSQFFFVIIPFIILGKHAAKICQRYFKLQKRVFFPPFCILLN